MNYARKRYLTFICKRLLDFRQTILWPGRWTRSDSNRRSSPCKGDAFPLGHGPQTALGADERTRTSTPLRAIDPKSIASAIPPRRPSASPSCGDQRFQSIARIAILRKFGADLYPRFCQVIRLWRWVNLVTCTVIYLSNIATPT